MFDNYSEGYDYSAYHDNDDYLARSFIEQLIMRFDASELFMLDLDGRGIIFRWVKKVFYT